VIHQGIGIAHDPLFGFDLFFGSYNANTANLTLTGRPPVGGQGTADLMNHSRWVSSVTVVDAPRLHSNWPLRSFAEQPSRAVRSDWAARFFKTWASATKACDLARIESNGVQAKPAPEEKVGDKLRVKNEGGEFSIDVLGVSEIRGLAAVAQMLYSEGKVTGTEGDDAVRGGARGTVEPGAGVSVKSGAIRAIRIFQIQS